MGEKYNTGEAGAEMCDYVREYIMRKDFEEREQYANAGNSRKNGKKTIA
ncbi:MAG: hypothetical protein NC430_09385 [bacterium]|nr:hypothetical protein [bacterium]